MSEPSTVHLSLVSHTNAGKTTLARTLLGQDIGEVRDAAHVTEIAEVHTLLELDDGTRLTLWDTPGFGDTARLLKRLKLAGNPLGWLLTQVWDRFRDRPLWCSQQAVRNARDEADVVLYLVNAAENPADAAYVTMEMQILTWIGKPVVLLLNQMGPPRSASDEHAEIERWRSHLVSYEVVREVLVLDAFARCWIQEDRLLSTIANLVPTDRRGAFDRLSTAWKAKNIARFEQAMGVLGAQLARAALDREELGEKTLRQHARELVQSLGLSDREGSSDKSRAMAALAERLDVDIRASTDALIGLHGLGGQAATEVLRRIHSDYAASEPLSESSAAVIGGIASGALLGLKADLAAGGLTFGAGLLTGGILGALGAAGLARGYNYVRGDKPAVRWAPEFLLGLTRSAVLRYLAVAHYGRGRGDYVQSEHPIFWRETVNRSVDGHAEELLQLFDAGQAVDTDSSLTSGLTDAVTKVTADVLRTLYGVQADIAA